MCDLVLKHLPLVVLFELLCISGVVALCCILVYRKRPKKWLMTIGVYALPLFTAYVLGTVVIGVLTIIGYLIGIY